MGRVVSVRVDAEGRLVLPEEVRVSLGVQGGGELLLQVTEQELRATTRQTALRKLQAMVPAWKPGDPLWSDELIAERRAEAARDLAEGQVGPSQSS
ncbi:MULTISPECIES: AbrB/MazE/SpoVT family DNA-binding domain-containing protein [Roseomonadaceae]|uniref:AbrB/MazE/SpoVT family DNA-binding domain-containing protein n=1 Tax=Falsiroseomonas oleicola TaxID=2801474 RepID=A0ABS6HAJ4_9PROT|nr:AbrB/MazE/SpoVT family DNA-binding domain-containing protein [Roseomonas oleicola]MBU8545737.1 AbrB/MazE/SpoVT family DNA-binding domain-containing protein [Roseomonas oleicola]